jgi:hypothetical protein
MTRTAIHPKPYMKHVPRFDASEAGPQGQEIHRWLESVRFVAVYTETGYACWTSTSNA